MAYQYNIPLATDQLSKSQGDIQGNFNALGAIAGNAGGAASFSLNGTMGFNFLYLASQMGSIPPITFPAGNVALYSATNPTTTLNELYINKTNQATVVQIPATASVLSITSAPAANSSGWSYLPSGILMKWGVVNPLTNGVKTQTITFPGGAPVFQGAPFSIIVSQMDSSSNPFNNIISVNQSTTSTNQFTVRCLNNFDGFVGIYYLAIGY
jgi:hypothetical protein